MLFLRVNPTLCIHQQTGQWGKNRLKRSWMIRLSLLVIKDTKDTWSAAKKGQILMTLGSPEMNYKSWIQISWKDTRANLILTRYGRVPPTPRELVLAPESEEDFRVPSGSLNDLARRLRIVIRADMVNQIILFLWVCISFCWVILTQSKSKSSPGWAIP